VNLFMCYRGAWLSFFVLMNSCPSGFANNQSFAKYLGAVKNVDQVSADSVGINLFTAPYAAMDISVTMLFFLQLLNSEF
jgi:hypothetical protein